MPSFPERLFTAFCRAFAVVAALVPVSAALVLVWAVLSYAFGPSASDGRGLAQIILLTIGTAVAGALGGGVLGVGSALAAEELSPGPVRRAINMAIALLSAIPAVAYGWFAVLSIGPLAAAHPLGAATPFIAASVVLAVMVAPTTCALVTRALARIPSATRHAAAAAGANRLQTTALTILPSLRGRIGAAVLAAFARAIGEATALQILFAALAAAGSTSAATLATWLFSTAAGLHLPNGQALGLLSCGALALLAIETGCALVAAQTYRGAQWA